MPAPSGSRSDRPITRAAGARLRRAALIAALALPAAAVPAEAPGWVVEDGNSRVGFVASGRGGRVAGTFRRYLADLRFDPQRPGEGRLELRLDLSSADTGPPDDDRETGLPAWLGLQGASEAGLVASGFRRSGPHGYEADAVLSANGVSQALSLPVAWRQADASARMRAAVVLDADAFGLGANEPGRGETVGARLQIEADLLLIRPSAQGECGC